MKANYYPPNSYVRVVARADSFTGWAGTVDSTYNDGGGDMIHRVQFGDGNCAYYYADEITDLRSNRYPRPAPREQD